MAAAGKLPARRIGRAWIVDVTDHSPPRYPGRPLSARSAWGVLGLGEDRLSRSERRRALDRRAKLGEAPPGMLANRAAAHRFRAHPGLLGQLAADPRLLASGVSAAGRYRADIIALGELEAYVRAEDIESIEHEYALREPRDGVRPNVVLRTPQPDWPFRDGVEAAPLLVVAADLLDAGDERSVRAARELFS